MKCEICGYEIESGTNCPYCGSPLPQMASSAEVTAEVQTDHTQPDAAATALAAPVQRKPFGAGKVVLTVFLSILGGLLIVFLTCSLVSRWNPFHINEVFDSLTQDTRKIQTRSAITSGNGMEITVNGIDRFGHKSGKNH